MPCCSCSGGCPYGAGCGCHTSPGQCCCSGCSCYTTGYGEWEEWESHNGGCGAGSCGNAGTAGPCDLCQKRTRDRYRSQTHPGRCDCPSCGTTTQTEYRILSGNLSCHGESGCTFDCANTPNGNLVVDGCGVCGGGQTAGSCTTCGDGSPPGENETAAPCDSVCGSGAVVDNCGTCDSDSSNDCVQDCAGEWGGSASHDQCGVCNGGNNLDQGCGCGESGPTNYWYDSDGDGLGAGSPTSYCAPLGSPNPNSSGAQQVPGYPNPCPGSGTAGWCANSSDQHPDCTSNTVDSCGNCDGDCTGSAGDVTCGGSGNNTVTADCAGDCGGSAQLDDCGVCSGGNSDHEANSDQDCHGDCCGGTPNDVDGCGAYYSCGTCVEGNTGTNDEAVHGPTSDCTDLNGDGDCSGVTYTVDYGEDCAGSCGATSGLDDCGWCAGTTTTPISGGGFACYANVNTLGYTLATTGTGGPNGDGTDAQGQSIVPSLLSPHCTSNWAKDAIAVCGGEAIVDACGIPAGGDTGLTPNLCSESMGIDGRCYGSHSGPNMDNCGKCHSFCDDGSPTQDGGCDTWNSECLDCAGTPNGDAYWDDCSICICGSVETESCSVQDPNCKTNSSVSACSGVGGPELDCAEVCLGQPYHGAILDNCNECSDNNGSYSPWNTSTGGSVGHPYDSDRDCVGICDPDTSLCENCEEGCDPDNAGQCGVYIGDVGSNGVDDCDECAGNNYDCTNPYRDLDADTYYDTCTCSGCTDVAGYNYSSTECGGYACTIDNATCIYTTGTHGFTSSEGGIVTSVSVPNITSQIVAGTFLSTGNISIEIVELDPTPLLPYNCDGEILEGSCNGELVESYVYDNNIFKFTSDAEFQHNVRITMPFDSSWEHPTFIKLIDEDDDNWEIVSGGIFGDPNYPAGVAYIDVNAFSIYATANIDGCNLNYECQPYEIVYGCNHDTAYNYSDATFINVEYTPQACIEDGIAVEYCCLYFDTQCPIGTSGLEQEIIEFPAIYIAGGQVNNYISIPVTEAHKTLDENGIVDILNNSFYNENPNLNEDAEPDNSMLTTSTNIFLSFYGYEEGDAQNTSNSTANYFGNDFWALSAGGVGFKFLEGMSLNIRVDNPVWFKLKEVE